MFRKVKLLSQHDVVEVVKFQEYLADIRTMKREDFFRKYQEYMGLSDAELAGALAKEEAPQNE